VPRSRRRASASQDEPTDASPPRCTGRRASSSIAGLTEAAHALATYGGRVESIRADLRTYEGVETLYGDFARQTLLEAELDLIALNVTSTVHLAKRVVRRPACDPLTGNARFAAAPAAG
jgi:hypothetical protein